MKDGSRTCRVFPFPLKKRLYDVGFLEGGGGEEGGDES
jgi:hypothetical protein